MKVGAKVIIFKRSIGISKLWYVSYIGDANTLSVNKVNNIKPYNDIKVMRKECVASV